MLSVVYTDQENIFRMEYMHLFHVDKASLLISPSLHNILEAGLCLLLHGLHALHKRRDDVPCG